MNTLLFPHVAPHAFTSHPVLALPKRPTATTLNATYRGIQLLDWD